MAELDINTLISTFAWSICWGGKVLQVKKNKVFSSLT